MDTPIRGELDGKWMPAGPGPSIFIVTVTPCCHNSVMRNYQMVSAERQKEYEQRSGEDTYQWIARQIDMANTYRHPWIPCLNECGTSSGRSDRWPLFLGIGWFRPSENSVTPFRTVR